MNINLVCSIFFTVAITVNFSQARYSFVEGSGNVLIELMFSNPSSFDIIVHVMWDDITATGLNNSACLESDDTEDYLHGVYSVMFSVNMTMQLLNFTICDDDVLEEEETFSLTIVSNSNPDNVTNGSPDSVTVIIMDNDRKCLLLPFHSLSKVQFALCSQWQASLISAVIIVIITLISQ